MSRVDIGLCTGSVLWCLLESSQQPQVAGSGETCPAPKKKSDLWTFKAPVGSPSHDPSLFLSLVLTREEGRDPSLIPHYASASSGSLFSCGPALGFIWLLLAWASSAGAGQPA